MDRKRDMIVSGGLNFFASDIEEESLQHPKVLEVKEFDASLLLCPFSTKRSG